MEKNSAEPSTRKSSLFQWIRTAILLIFSILTFTGPLEQGVRWCSRPADQYNQRYLKESLDATTALLIPVTVIKAAADVIEGSTISGNAVVSQVTIQAGDVVKPILEYTDIAWKVLLANFTYLQIALFISRGGTAVSVPLLGFFFVLLLVATFPPFTRFETLRHKFQMISSRFFISAIVLLLLLPATISTTAFLSARITRPIQTEIQTSFDQISKTISLDELNEDTTILKKSSVLSQKLLYLQLHHKKISKDLATAIAKLIAIRILNGVIFPIGSLTFLVWLLKTKDLFSSAPEKK